MQLEPTSEGFCLHLDEAPPPDGSPCGVGGVSASPSEVQAGCFIVNLLELVLDIVLYLCTIFSCRLRIRDLKLAAVSGLSESLAQGVRLVRGRRLSVRLNSSRIQTDPQLESVAFGPKNLWILTGKEGCSLATDQTWLEWRNLPPLIVWKKNRCSSEFDMKVKRK